MRETNDELSSQADELDKTIKEEREKSINVVQEQLQREHELNRQINAANEEINERDGRLNRLQTELESTQMSEASLKDQLHKLEQSLFEQQAAGREKDLLQKMMADKETNIDQLEQNIARFQEELRMISEEKKHLQQLNSETAESLTNLKQELRETTVKREEAEEMCDTLQQEMKGIRDENGNLKKSIEEMKSTLVKLKEESQKREEQHETDVSQKFKVE